MLHWKSKIEFKASLTEVLHSGHHFFCTQEWYDKNELPVSFITALLPSHNQFTDLIQKPKALKRHKVTFKGNCHIQNNSVWFVLLH